MRLFVGEQQIGQIRHGDRNDLNPEFLHQFPFVDLHAPENLRSGTDLADPEMPHGLDDACGAEEGIEALPEFWVGQRAVGNVGELDAELLQDLCRCKHAALRIRQPVAVCIRGSVSGAPDEHRLSDGPRQLCHSLLAAEVAVRNKDRINLLTQEKCRCFFCICDIEQKSFVVDRVKRYKFQHRIRPDLRFDAVLDPPRFVLVECLWGGQHTSGRCEPQLQYTVFHRIICPPLQVLCLPRFETECF